MQNEEAQLAAGALRDGLARINTNEHPAYVSTLVGTFTGAINEAHQAAVQLTADRAELRAKADLIPPAGAARIEREAQAEAEAKGKDSLNRARTATENLRRAALLDALPQPAPEREQLGRSELSEILGTGSPEQIMERVHRVAERGSRDAVAALLSPYGRAILETRGLVGSDLEGAIASARKVVVESAADNAGRHTEKELRSARLFRSVGDLEASIAASSFYLGAAGIRHA